MAAEHRWGTSSQKRLEAAHEDLRVLADLVLRTAPFDVSCTESHRSEQDHNSLPPGASYLTWEESKHSRQPSWAIHLEPYPIDYNNRFRYDVLAGVVLSAAERLGIRDRLRWGGDWDGDWTYSDQTLHDLAHYELTREGEIKMPTDKPLVNLDGLFGDKKWYKSMTAWGLLLLAVGSQFFAEAGANDLLPGNVAEMGVKWSTSIGTVLAGLGIRRRI